MTTLNHDTLTDILCAKLLQNLNCASDVVIDLAPADGPQKRVIPSGCIAKQKFRGGCIRAHGGKGWAFDLANHDHHVASGFTHQAACAAKCLETNLSAVELRKIIIRLSGDGKYNHLMTGICGLLRKHGRKPATSRNDREPAHCHRRWAPGWHTPLRPALNANSITRHLRISHARLPVAPERRQET